MSEKPWLRHFEVRAHLDYRRHPLTGMLRIRESLPKSAVGKVLRRVLREEQSPS